jgi:hypothetical protein
LLYIGLNWLGRNYADVTDTIREFIRQIRIETIINRITFDGATTTQCSRLSGMRSSEWTATRRSDWMRSRKTQARVACHVSGGRRPAPMSDRVLETHSLREISAAISGVERRDQAADKAVNEPNEGRRPSQQGHVNEHVSDGEQKV